MRSLCFLFIDVGVNLLGGYSIVRSTLAARKQQNNLLTQWTLSIEKDKGDQTKIVPPNWVRMRSPV